MNIPNKGDVMDVIARMGLLVLIIAVILRMSDISEDRRNSIEAEMEYLNSKIYELEHQIEYLGRELDILQDDYSYVESILWDITDYLNIYQ